MEISEVIFPDSFPKLDLHGYDRDTARVAINDFINDNLKMKNEIIVIIHGFGTGIIREETYKTLKKNKNVLEYKSANSNRGCTIVKIH
jgi:DNA mismatch repair protein MutS2